MYGHGDILTKIISDTILKARIDAGNGFPTETFKNDPLYKQAYNSAMQDRMKSNPFLRDSPLYKLIK